MNAGSFLDYELIRTWNYPPYLLCLYDTGEMDKGIRSGSTILAYRFYCEGKEIFRGEDFSPSPIYAIDSNETVGALLGFLSLRVGDTDPEYFEDYSPEQMEFARQHGEHLSLLAHYLENGEDI